MTDYSRIQKSYAYGKPDAHLLLEQSLLDAVQFNTDDRILGKKARALAAAVCAGKAERMLNLDFSGKD